MKLSLVNAAYVYVEGDYEDIFKLKEHFTFEVPDFQHIPAYKNGYWDGKICLFNGRNHQIYAGLYEKIRAFAHEHNIPLEIDAALEDRDEFWTPEKIGEEIGKLNLTKEPRPYQIQAIQTALQSRRGLFLMPTGSGKSLVIYLILRLLNLRSLIIVPTTGLVKQLSKNFADYGYTEEIHQIYAKQDKEKVKDITISTWQSIMTMPKNWSHQFDLVLVDEAHTAKAKSLTTIMENATESYYRYGFTGTLDGTKTNGMSLEGLFGPIDQVTTSAELMNEKVLADLKISFLLMNYPNEERNDFWTGDKSYDDEIDYIIYHPKRNSVIRKLAIGRPGNNLVIFRYRKHGKLLYDSIKEKTDRPVYFIDGKVDVDVREEIRLTMENEKNAILIGSTQTISTGIDIPSLASVIFTHPTKAKIRNLQSIGRVLRRTEDKTQAHLFDIADDLSIKTKRGSTKKNITLNHFLVRVDTYTKEKFHYSINRIDLTKSGG